MPAGLGWVYDNSNGGLAESDFVRSTNPDLPLDIYIGMVKQVVNKLIYLCENISAGNVVEFGIYF